MEFFARLNEFYQMGKKPGGVKNLDVENSDSMRFGNQVKGNLCLKFYSVLVGSVLLIKT